MQKPSPALYQRLLKLPVFTLTLVFFALGCWASPSLAQQLQFDRAALAAGDWWRLLTGHFTHFNPEHLLWDAAAFLALGAVCEWRNRRLFIKTVAASMLTISVGVWLVLPEIQVYRGLSGLDSALFILAAAQLFADQVRCRDWPAAILIAIVSCGFVFKIGFEVYSGSTLFARIADAAAPVPLAHIAGAGTGALICLLGRWRGYSAESFSAADFD